MNILLVAATDAEIAPLLESLESVRNAEGRLKFFKKGKHNIDLLITGVGMTATAYYLGKTLSDHYDLALNIGLAGSFDRSIEIGCVLNITEDIFSELGAEDGEKFLSLKDLGLYGISGVKNTSFIQNKILEALPKVKGITVNTVHGSEASIKNASESFHPVTESMEGAAFLMACIHEGIPCAQVRAVSNYVERRDKSKWNIPLAIANLNKVALNILNEF